MTTVCDLHQQASVEPMSFFNIRPDNFKKFTLNAGLSDPYVIIRILPDNKAIKPRQSAKKSETLNPVFNETHELYVNYVHMLVAAGKSSCNK
jgi:Ca2+-dependent lipid-binding protein